MGFSRTGASGAGPRAVVELTGAGSVMVAMPCMAKTGCHGSAGLREPVVLPLVCLSAASLPLGIARRRLLCTAIKAA